MELHFNHWPYPDIKNYIHFNFLLNMKYFMYRLEFEKYFKVYGNDTVKVFFFTSGKIYTYYAVN